MNDVASSERISLYDPGVLVVSVTPDQIRQQGGKLAAVHRMLCPLVVEEIPVNSKELRLRVLGHLLQWAQRSETSVEIVDRHGLVAKVEGTLRHLAVVRIKGGCSDG